MAAGRCATCGALCCADCVELLMGVTQQRATCRACIDAGDRPMGTGSFVKAGAILAFALAALFALLVYAAGA